MLTRAVTDGVVTLRPPRAGDVAALVAGRDEEFHRWLGPGSPAPEPVACVEVDGSVVGWADHDRDQPWLGAGEVNVGYALAPGARGHGHATRALALLVHHLAVAGEAQTATALVRDENRRSLAVVRRAGFVRAAGRPGQPAGNVFLTRAVPPLSYTDGVVTIRRMCAERDLDAHLSGMDDEQMRWMWRPGQRESWEAMTAEEQRVHVRRWMAGNQAGFGAGPKWSFAVDTAADPYVAYVDCDLANDNVAAGDANVSYSCHPAHRGRGHVRRAVGLVLRFLREHTAAREAHIVVDRENQASLRVARAVGAERMGQWVNEQGRTMVRHVVLLRG